MVETKVECVWHVSVCAFGRYLRFGKRVFLIRLSTVSLGASRLVCDHVSLIGQA